MAGVDERGADNIAGEIGVVRVLRAAFLSF